MAKSTVPRGTLLCYPPNSKLVVNLSTDMGGDAEVQFSNDVQRDWPIDITVKSSWFHGNMLAIFIKTGEVIRNGIEYDFAADLCKYPMLTELCIDFFDLKMAGDILDSCPGVRRLVVNGPVHWFGLRDSAKLRTFENVVDLRLAYNRNYTKHFYTSLNEGCFDLFPNVQHFVSCRYVEIPVKYMQQIHTICVNCFLEFNIENIQEWAKSGPKNLHVLNANREMLSYFGEITPLAVFDGQVKCKTSVFGNNVTVHILEYQLRKGTTPFPVSTEKVQQMGTTCGRLPPKYAKLAPGTKYHFEYIFSKIYNDFGQINNITKNLRVCISEADKSAAEDALALINQIDASFEPNNDDLLNTIECIKEDAELCSDIESCDTEDRRTVAGVVAADTDNEKESRIKWGKLATVVGAAVVAKQLAREAKNTVAVTCINEVSEVSEVSEHIEESHDSDVEERCHTSGSHVRALSFGKEPVSPIRVDFDSTDSGSDSDSRPSTPTISNYMATPERKKRESDSDDSDASDAKRTRLEPWRPKVSTLQCVTRHLPVPQDLQYVPFCCFDNKGPIFHKACALEYYKRIVDVLSADTGPLIYNN
ncbi:MAG: hypothetical protein MUO31_07925 [Thermodesulfovibrionales bacterium]|nr:hypothetical protein [Thermodesulfovibrionales bacterium]